MSLALLNEDYGVQVARALSRELVMNLRPPGEDERILKSPQFQPTAIERWPNCRPGSARISMKTFPSIVGGEGGLSRRH